MNTKKMLMIQHEIQSITDYFSVPRKTTVSGRGQRRIKPTGVVARYPIWQAVLGATAKRSRLW
jgi:hypothetical protein